MVFIASGYFDQRCSDVRCSDAWRSDAFQHNLKLAAILWRKKRGVLSQRRSSRDSRVDDIHDVDICAVISSILPLEE